MIYEIESLFTGFHLVGGNARQTMLYDTDGVAVNSRQFLVVNNRDPLVNKPFIIGKKSKVQILRTKIETVGAKGLRTSPIIVPSFVAENYCGHTATISFRQLGNTSPLYQQKSKITSLNEWNEQDVLISAFGNSAFSDSRYFQLDGFSISYDSLGLLSDFENASFSIKVKMQVLASENV